MGTRSLTKFYDGNGSTRTPIVTVYRQMDGYPSGHGLELAKFLKSKRIVNGLGNDTDVANGTGCLAAQFIKEFKDGPGGIYIMIPGNHWQEYDYRVFVDEKATFGEHDVTVKAYDCYGKNGRTRLLFSGSVEDFETFCNDQKDN